METNVSMGDGVSNSEAYHNQHQGTQNIILSSTFQTSTIDVTTSLPPFHSTISTATQSPTFDSIMQQPITSLLPSQSIKEPKIVNDDETDDGAYTGLFADIEFDPEEENIPDHMLMFGK